MQVDENLDLVTFTEETLNGKLHFLRSGYFRLQWIRSKMYLINPFQPSVTFHTETSHLICTANQATVFYMKINTGLERVKFHSGAKNLWINVGRKQNEAQYWCVLIRWNWVFIKRSTNIWSHISNGKEQTKIMSVSVT